MLHDFRRHCRLSLSFYCVHQRNLRISTTLSILRKYEQKALCKKIPLSRGVTGKTFTDTEKKIKINTINKTNKSHPHSDWDCHTGNPITKKSVSEKLQIFRLLFSLATEVFFLKLICIDFKVYFTSEKDISCKG